MKFDVASALKSGYSEQEVAEFLASQSKFDLGEATKSGYSYGDVIGFLGSATSASKPEPAADDYFSDPSGSDLGASIMSAAQPLADSKLVKPKAKPVEPTPYRDKREAIDDAVSLLEEGADPAQVRSAFERNGVKFSEIQARGEQRGSDYFKRFNGNQPTATALPSVAPDLKSFEPTATDEVVNTLKRGKEQAGQTVDVLINRAGVTSNERLGEQLASRQRRTEAAAPGEEIASAMDAANKAGENGFLDVLAVYANKPQALAAAIAQSAIGSSPGILATTLGAALAGPVGGAAGAGLSSAAMEYGSAYVETFGKYGIDVSDPKQVAAALSDERFLYDARERGIKRGVSVGTFDALTAGLAGKFIGPAMDAAKVGNLSRGQITGNVLSATGKEIGLQSAGGALGEATGQAAVGEFNANDILLEAISEPATGITEVYSNLSNAPRTAGDQAAQALSRLLDGGQFGGVDANLSTVNPNIQTLRDTAVTAERQQKKAIADAALTQIGQSGSVDEAIAAAQVAVSVPAIGPTEAVVNQERTAESVVEQRLADAREKASAATSKLQRTTRLDDASLLQTALASAGIADQAAVAAPDPGTEAGVPASAGGTAGSPAAPALGGQPESSNPVATGQEPARVWYGRRGDGYLTPGDASLALPSRRRESPDLDWRMEQQKDGRYRLAGYAAPVVEPTPPAARPIDPRLIPMSKRVPTPAAYRALATEKAGNPDLFNADLAKELFPEYNGANSAALNDRASAVRDAAFQERLAQPAKPGEVVTLTAGGTGSGKSTTVPRSGIVYDSTLGKQNPQKVFDLIDQVLATGRDVDLNYVFTDPEVALVRAVRRAQDIGRTLTIDTHLKTHKGANATARAVQERYAGDGRVQVKAFDNTGTGPKRVDKIPLYDYNSAGEKLQSTLKAERNAGRIDDALYIAFSGSGAQRAYGQDGDAGAGGTRAQALGVPPVDDPRATAQPPSVLNTPAESPQTPAPAGVSVSADRFPSVESVGPVSFGPSSITPRIIARDKPLYRETNTSGLDDLLRGDAQAEYRPVFVTDNADLALGQGDNKGISITFRPNALSGRENVKPGTGDVTGREYQADIVAPRAVQSITFAYPKQVNLVRGLTRRVLQQEFTRTDLPDGRVQFARKGLESATPSAPVPVPLSYTRQSDGTVLVQGTKAEVKAALPELTGVPSRGGVVFGKSRSDAVVQRLDALLANVSNIPEKVNTSAQRVEEAPKIEQVASASQPTAQEQRRAFAESEAKRTASGARLRSNASATNPFRAFLGKHGVSSAVASEFVPGAAKRKRALVPGYGPIFRKTGKALDQLAQDAVQEGFLTTPDERQLYDLIERAIRGERVIAQYAEGVAESEGQALIDRQRALEEDAASDTEALPDALLFEVEDNDADIPWEAAGSNVTAEQAMRTLGFTDEEIQNAEIANQPRGSQEADAGSAEPQQTAGGEAPRNRAQRDPAPGPDAEGLTAPSRADIEAQQDRAARADELDQRAQIDREASGFDLQSQTEESRTDNTGDMFGGPSAQDVLAERGRRKPKPDDGEPPLFSREQAGPSPGLTRTQFSDAMASAFGKSVASRLEQKGVVVAVQRQSELPDRMTPFLRDGDTVFGAYDRANDKTYVVLENISEGMVRELALHEIGLHYGFERMLGKDKYDQVMRRLDVMRRGGNPAAQDAYLNAKKNAARESDIPEETLAYLVQNAPENSLVQDIIARIKAFLFKEFGIGGSRLTEADLAALARAAVKHASRGEVTTNAPAEQGFGGVPAFSRSQTNPASPGYTLDPEGFWLKQRRLYQDYFIRMKQVQDAVRKQGGTISEATDTYMAEELGYGRVQEQIKDFGENAVRPMVDAAQKANISLDELALYAYAKHAPERNAAIAERNSRFADGGSGMTDAEAKAIVDKVKADGKETEYEDLRQRLMGMTQATRLIQLDEGLVTPEEYQALQSAYQDYVPLRGFEQVDEEDKPTGRGTGKGWQIRGKENMRALGRSSKAGQVIENIIADYERAIVRAERNQIGKVFLNFVQTNPDPNLWEVDAEKTRQAYDRQTGRVSRDTMIDKGEDTIGVKLNGQEVYVKIKDPLLARALLEGWKKDWGAPGQAAVNSFGVFTALLRNVFTRYNPEFAITNAVRDFGFGSVAVLDALGEKGVAKFWGHYAGAMRTGFKSETGRITSASPEWRRYFTEYRAAGGTTGGFYTKDTEEIQGDIRGMLIEAGAAPNTTAERLKYNSATRLATKALRVLELAGATSEHAARVAAYRTAREMGKTPNQAASIAKNLTVNFNRKGERGQLLNTFYLFYNASIQGTTRLAQMLKNKKVRRYMYALIGGVTLLALMNAENGGEDEDDGQPYWDKIPAYVKERNIVIMLPPGIDVDGTKKVGSKGRYVTIPFPYGLNVFPVIGNQLADMQRHTEAKTHGTGPLMAAVRVFSAFTASINPFGGSLDNGHTAMMMILPTAFDIPHQMYFGVNGFGRDVAPYKREDDPKPNAYNVNIRQAGGPAEKIAQWLNTVSGGDETESGVIDVSPGSIENFVNMTTGGPGDFIYKFAALGMAGFDAATGGSPDFFVKQVPVYRRLYGEVDGDTNQGLFYERSKEASEAKKKAKLKDDYGKTLTDPIEIAANERADSAADTTRDLAENRRDIIRIRQDKTLSDDTRRKIESIYKAQRDELIDSFNREWMSEMKSALNAPAP